jgi:hypothetical protein
MRHPKHYASKQEVDALLEAMRPTLEKRLAAAGMLTDVEVGRIMGATAAEVDEWVTKGRAIGLRLAPLELRLPRWQFEPHVWRTLPRLSRALDTTDGWTLLMFLETPHGALGGRTPRQAIEQGDASRVVAVAKCEGY